MTKQTYNFLRLYKEQTGKEINLLLGILQNVDLDYPVSKEENDELHLWYLALNEVIARCPLAKFGKNPFKVGDTIRQKYSDRAMTVTQIDGRLTVAKYLDSENVTCRGNYYLYEKVAE